MSSSSTKQQQQEQQEQTGTFKDPNKRLVKSKNTKAGMDSDEADLHNEEVLREERGEPDNFVQVAQIFTDADADPINENLTDADRSRISGFNSNAYQTELDKEKFARIGYMIWQSKQLYYTAFRRIGWNEEQKKMEWEQRDYKYHQLTNSQKLTIKKLAGTIKTLETKNRLWMGGVVNDALYNDMINREVDIDVEIEELKDQLQKLKFKSYFMEDDDDVLTDMSEVDIRDLVEAAEYRESGVPFSRKLASYRTTSVSDQGKTRSKY